MTNREILCTIRKAAALHNVHWYSTPLWMSPRFNQRHKTCAVISSSGVLQRQRYGREIDASDMVVRFNTAPIEGFEEIVGSRDDLRILNNQIASKVLYNKSLPGDTFNKDGTQLQLHNSATYVSLVEKAEEVREMEILKARYPNLDVYWGNLGMQAAMTQVVHQIYGDDAWFSITPEAHDWLATTGAVGMLLALDICDEVRAYGMAASKNASAWPYHYFDDHTKQWHWKASENLWHRMFNVEKDMWRRLSQTSPQEVDVTDLAVIPGFRKLDCEGVQGPQRTQGSAIATGSAGAGQSSGLGVLPPCTPELERKRTPCLGPGDGLAAPKWRWFGLGVAATLAGLLPVAICVVVGGGLWRDEESGPRFTAQDTGGAAPLRSPTTTMAETSPTAAAKVTVSALPIYVALLVGTDVVASAAAQANGGEYPWDPIFVVLLIEVSKCLASLAMLWVVDRQCQPFNRFSGISNGEPCGILKTEVQQELTAVIETDTEAAEVGQASSAVEPWPASHVWLEEVSRLMPVAVLCAGNNCLVLIALSKIHLDSYVVWRNSAILFNAFIWSTYFRQVLLRYQRIAMFGLTMGCWLSSFQSDGSLSPLGWPVLIVLGSALLSAVTAVLNGAVLKTRKTSALGANRLNVLLYCQTSVVLLLALVLRCKTTGVPVGSITVGFNQSAVSLILMQTMLGLVISRVLIHTSSVATTIAGGVREVVTVCVAPLFVISRLDWVSLASVLWVFFAVVLYMVPRHLTSDNRHSEC